MPHDPTMPAKLQKMQAAQAALEVSGQINGEKVTEWALLELALALRGVEGTLNNIYDQQIRMTHSLAQKK
jgi:hypothetical protein